MRFKMIIAIVDDGKTEKVTKAARDHGATGCTVITSARGEGLNPATTFMGLSLEGQRDFVVLLVEEHKAREILEKLSEAGRFEEEPGTGIAFQVDVEDVIGLKRQMEVIEQEIEKEL